MDGFLPQQIRCRHKRKDGTPCLNTIATRTGPLVVSKMGGREVYDPGAVKCEKCKKLTHFRGGAEGELAVTPGRDSDRQLRVLAAAS